MNNHYPRKRKGLTEQPIGDELYLFGAGGEKLTVLNATARLIWSWCDGEHTPADMSKHLQKIFADPSPHEVSADLEECLAQFKQQGILEPDSED